MDTSWKIFKNQRANLNLFYKRLNGILKLISLCFPQIRMIKNINATSYPSAIMQIATKCSSFHQGFVIIAKKIFWRKQQVYRRVG